MFEAASAWTEVDVFLARYPEDDGNALIFQALDHQLSGFTHPAPPLMGTIVAG